MTWLAFPVTFRQEGPRPGEHLDAEVLPAGAEGGEPEPEFPCVLAGTVRAVLRPRGLVEMGGLIESAWWQSDEPGPARDSTVAVEWTPDGLGCIARPLSPADHEPGTPAILPRVPPR